MVREDRIGKVYRHKWHRKIVFPDWLRRILQRPRSFLAGLVREGMTAADIGCGTGFYSTELAGLVGPAGKVLAVDLQQEMLDRAEKKAKKAGVLGRIEFIKCSRGEIKVHQHVDFVLTMWVVHEAADRPGFLRQIGAILKPAGKFLLAEPKKIVSEQRFEEICSEAEQAGLRKISEAKVGLSIAAIFEKKRG